MEEIYCPICNIELMKHEAGQCLNAWVVEELKNDPWFNQLETGLSIPYFSSRVIFAFPLMERVWEMDDGAVIHKNSIHVKAGDHIEDGNTYRVWKFITGETFPLCVCRAYLFLKSQEQ